MARPRSHGTSTKPVVPHFYLYGEPPRDVHHRFLHLEDLADRSRPGEWNIRPHTHANLHHVIFIATGGGETRVDGDAVAFVAPALLLVPAQCVHEFAWHPESTGRVLTVSDAYLSELFAREPGLRLLFAQADCLPIPPHAPEQAMLTESLVRLLRELTWTAPGHAAAVEAHLISLLVEVLRIAQRRGENVLPGPQAEIVAHFRAAIEGGFRRRLPLETYAAKLGVSVARLRSACLKVARKPPLHLLQDRVLLEAKRLLLYSNMTVSEGAYFLGFDDPAYFSRLFRRQIGESPRAFRKRHFSPH